MLKITLLIENNDLAGLTEALDNAEEEGLLQDPFTMTVDEIPEPEEQEYNSDSKLEGERDY